MKKKDTDIQAELFSEDAEENLRIENEILHLKIKAELGGEMMGSQPLPPALENKFLKNVLELEHAFANNRQVKIFDFIGRPGFRRAAELNDDEIVIALNGMTDLLASKNIEIDFAGEYDARLKYGFITGELFDHETDDINVPGLITHYIYEEFHPDHRADIESRVIEFLEGWVDQQIDENSWELGEAFKSPQGDVLTKEQVLKKISIIFESFAEFCEPAYAIESIVFDVTEQDQSGDASVIGAIAYNAIMENGARVRFDGRFEMRLMMEHKWWSMYYFEMPGFVW